MILYSWGSKMKVLLLDLQKIVATVGCSCVILFAQGKDSDGKLYFGIRGGGSTSSYFIDADRYYEDFFSEQREYGGESFDLAAFVSLQSGFFAFQTEVLFTEFYYSSSQREYFEYRNNDIWRWDRKYVENKYETSKYALVFPFLLKMVFRPNNVFIQAFAGPHFCANIGEFKVKQNPVEKWYVTDLGSWSTMGRGDENVEPYPWGMTAGVSFGAKAKTGTLFFDIRYLTDLETFSQGYQWINNGHAYYSAYFFSYRTKISLTVGYEFGNGIDIKR
jgi:hypothetical protein